MNKKLCIIILLGIVVLLGCFALLRNTATDYLTPNQQRDFEIFLKTEPSSYVEYKIKLDGKNFIYCKSKGFMLYED